MRKFGASELTSFLHAVDDNLSSPARIVVLGGGALALAHDDTYRTTDIDLWNTPSRDVLRACERAREQTGLRVTMEHSGVSDAPYSVDDRLVSVLHDLKYLKVLAFDRYDVALSKVIRGYSKDLDAIHSLHQRHPLDAETLVNLYLSEMDHIMGNRRVVDQNFVNLIDHLYGPVAAQQVRSILPPRTPPTHHRAPR